MTINVKIIPITSLHFWAPLLFFILSGGASAEDHFMSFRVDPARHEVRMYLRDDAGRPYKDFSNLDSELRKDGKRLVFAMNAGMYMGNLMPLGLFIESGKLVRKLNTRKKAFGNFYIQPNGVFLIAGGAANIISTDEFRRGADVKKIDFATQSGPMLIINHRVNPALVNYKNSRLIRNGVCVDDTGSTFFSISKSPVTFVEMAAYFTSSLRCKDALYLDGAVSQIYWPARKIGFSPNELGPMIGVIAKPNTSD